MIRARKDKCTRVRILFAWIIRFTKKKKVFREKYDSDIIQKYINIFLFLRKLKRNLN